MTESQDSGQELSQYVYTYMPSSQYLDAYYYVVGYGNVILDTLRGGFWKYRQMSWSVLHLV